MRLYRLSSEDMLVHDQKRRILYTKRQTVTTKWDDILLCDIKHDVCGYMSEHAPNVCVRALLDELKLETHLEHSISPRQFDRTEWWGGDLYNWRDNASLDGSDSE